MSTRGHQWTPEQRERYRATVEAKRLAARCDLCAVGRGEPIGANGRFRPAQVLSFRLLHDTVTESGTRTSRAAGVVFMCRRCWEQTAGRRRLRKPNARSGPRESAHKLLNAS